MYEQDQYANRPVSREVQRRRRLAWGALALALVVVVGFIAGHGVGSSSKSTTPAAKTVKPADAQQNVTAKPAPDSAAAKRRRREKRRERAAAQNAAPVTTAPSTTPTQSAPPKPTPHANTPQGQQELQQSPDCKNAPPPPPGYKGPVQC